MITRSATTTFGTPTSPPYGADQPIKARSGDDVVVDQDVVEHAEVGQLLPHMAAEAAKTDDANPCLSDSLLSLSPE